MLPAGLISVAVVRPYVEMPYRGVPIDLLAAGWLPVSLGPIGSNGQRRVVRAKYAWFGCRT